MKNKTSKITWRILSKPKNKWIRDSLLYIRVSTLTISMLKKGITINTIESILQDLGMNIEDWQLELIIKRYKND